MATMGYFVAPGPRYQNVAAVNGAGAYIVITGAH